MHDHPLQYIENKIRLCFFPEFSPIAPSTVPLLPHTHTHSHRQQVHFQMSCLCQSRELDTIIPTQC